MGDVNIVSPLATPLPLPPLLPSLLPFIDDASTCCCCVWDRNARDTPRALCKGVIAAAAAVDDDAMKERATYGEEDARDMTPTPTPAARPNALCDALLLLLL